MQMGTCKVNFVLTRPTIDEGHSCNDFPKNTVFRYFSEVLSGFATLGTY